MLDRFWFALAVQVQCGGPWGTVPELMFEKKGLIPAVKHLLLLYKLEQGKE